MKARLVLLMLVAAIIVTVAMASVGAAHNSKQFGANPQLPPPERGLLPSMTIANPSSWGNRQPVVPKGFTIRAIATDLQIPRQTLVLPNGDILVAEGRGGGAPVLTPKDCIAGFIKAKGKYSCAKRQPPYFAA
jgi:glucose/arabinose dehydrogenase